MHPKINTECVNPTQNRYGQELLQTFLQKAIKIKYWLNDDEYLKLIKNKLQHNILTTKLFDPVGNTKDIERAYIEMVSRYQSGQNPEDIYIKN